MPCCKDCGRDCGKFLRCFLCNAKHKNIECLLPTGLFDILEIGLDPFPEN